MAIALFRTLVHEEVIENVTKVLRSGWLSLGPTVAEFEKRFADYVDAPYAVAFSSATAALHTAIHLLDLPKTSSVISTPMTFISTNHVILYEGLPIIFADIDKNTGNLDLGSIRKACNVDRGELTRPKAMMFVHYGGTVGDLDLLYEIAEQYKLTIIEDCAHAAGASYKIPNYPILEKVGHRAKLACFSFHAVKNLPLGDGGMLTTTDEEFAARARSLRWLGIDKSTADRTKGDIYGWKYDVGEVGFKSYMNDINAAIGLGQLPYLDEDNAYRRRIYNTYKDGGLPMLNTTEGSSHHLAVMLASNVVHKERIMANLVKHDIQFGVHYTPNYYYPMYSDFPRIDGCPNAEEFYSRCISLPNHLFLQFSDLCRVISAVREVL